MTTTPPPDQPDTTSGVPSPDLTPPAAVRLAVRLMWVGAVVSLISTVVALATYDTFRDTVAEQARTIDPAVSQDAIDTQIAVGITFAVVIGVIGALVWLWIAWKNGQGRAWARTVATVLGGLNIVFTLLSFASGQTESAVLLLSLVNLVLAIAILVLLWRKESTSFFDAASNRHTA